MSDILGYINIYDAVFVIVILLSFIISFKNGLLYSVVSFFKVIGSAILSGYVGNRYSYLIYDKYLKSRLINTVAEKLEDFKDGLITSFGNDVIGKAISEYLSKTAIGNDLDNLSEKIIEEGVQSSIVGGIKLIIFVLVFLLSLLVFSWFQSILLHTNDVPVLGFVNQLFGGVFGALVGIVILYLISMLLSVFLDYNVSFVNREEITNSYLFSIIFRLNPLFK